MSNEDYFAQSPDQKSEEQVWPKRAPPLREIPKATEAQQDGDRKRRSKNPDTMNDEKFVQDIAQKLYVIPEANAENKPDKPELPAGPPTLYRRRTPRNPLDVTRKSSNGDGGHKKAGEQEEARTSRSTGSSRRSQPGEGSERARARSKGDRSRDDGGRDRSRSRDGKHAH